MSFVSIKCAFYIALNVFAFAQFRTKCWVWLWVWTIEQGSYGKFWKVTEIINAIFQDVERFEFLFGKVLEYPKIGIT